MEGLLPGEKDRLVSCVECEQEVFASCTEMILIDAQAYYRHRNLECWPDG